MRILLIEDNPDHVIFTKRILKKASQDYEVDSAGEGKEGMRKLASGNYDLVLCDYRLPDASALDILKEMKGQGKDLPFITVTSAGSEKIAVELMKEGAYDYIVKDSAYESALPVVIQRAQDRHNVEKEKERLEEELNKSNEKLKEMYAIKSEFTSMVSHELRTPLTAIKEGIAIVLDGTAGDLNAEQKDFLSLAKRNVDRLARLINDVLDFQKLEAQKMTFNMQENDINELVKEVHHTMAPLADKKNLGLALQLEEGLPRVKFDRDRIIQVLTNLVSNAIKFTEKGSIVIASSRGDNVIQVSVKDTGPGIKEEDLKRLFQQFEQLEKITERKTGGTGLGLAISKEIIDRHKGRIWVESEFDKGTTFWFILPVKAKDKVLVIDDDRAMLDLIKNFLEKEGYGVTCSEKGLDAVEIIGRDKPDLVILDMKLKDISGYEIIGRLRSNKDTSRTPIIIAMSGYSEELIKIEDRQEELALVSMAKPFDLQDLLSIARKLLQQRF